MLLCLLSVTRCGNFITTVVIFRHFWTIVVIGNYYGNFRTTVVIFRQFLVGKNQNVFTDFGGKKPWFWPCLTWYMAPW